MNLINFLFNLVNDIDVKLNYRIIQKVENNCIKIELRETEDLSEKLKPKEKKKEKDIIKIIDDSRKHKTKLEQDVEDITLKMDGFEKIHLEQYQKHLDQYKRFLNAYLEEESNVFIPNYAYHDEKKTEKREFKWGEEVITYHEIKDIVRRIHMNALLSGNNMGTISVHNSVDWQESEDYKFWKYVSKFNEELSFIVYDLVGSGG